MHTIDQDLSHSSSRAVLDRKMVILLRWKGYTGEIYRWDFHFGNMSSVGYAADKINGAARPGETVAGLPDNKVTAFFAVKYLCRETNVLEKTNVRL